MFMSVYINYVRDSFFPDIVLIVMQLHCTISIIVVSWNTRRVHSQSW